ncbi:glycosyltransferase family 2 protein [Roseovarius salis]|uniref:glycosyltransferase family 2 protein n=1 Tax=Roseovarius salis TaxID=3376063 RepID=UPI0037C5B063
MGVSELRHLELPDDVLAEAGHSLDRDLVRRGAVAAQDMARARVVQRACDTTIDRVLTAEGLVRRQDVLEAHARRFRSRQLTTPDLAGLEAYPVTVAPELLLRHAVLPVTDRDGARALVCSDPQNRRAMLPHLPPALAEARVLWAPRTVVQERIAALHRPALAAAMVTRVPEGESCRSWGRRPVRRVAVVAAGLMVMAAVTVMFPQAVLAGLAIWAVVTLVVSAVFKTLAFSAQLVTRDPEAGAGPRDDGAPLPRVSLLVPLFREPEIVHALVARLGRLTYPKCLLDVALVLEEEDAATRRALAAIDLPPWIRPVVVPDGQPRTKPRAMNYALDFCEGDIIGVLDAEDAPDPDQIAQVARRFHAVPPDVVCLQGYLDYYNPRQNWIARCFSIEYAAWFRRLLPGMARLGFAIPLGGTTLYFRRDALEKLGGWDSHNVTEDADLGFRLARHGYRTEMLATTTEEEANCHLWPWVKQRSRWLKGYMTTYLVHMRRPRRLLRQLGGWRFLGFQAHFVTALSQVILAPVLWSFWLVLLGLPHPLDPYVSRGMMTALGSGFLVVEVINLAIYASAVTASRHRHLMAWTPTMHFYAPLGAVAAYKAVYELALKPFFWDKTRHGLSLGTVPVHRPSNGALDLSGVELEPRHERL